jgi:hypothetical protein
MGLGSERTAEPKGAFFRLSSEQESVVARKERELSLIRKLLESLHSFPPLEGHPSLGVETRDSGTQ